MPGSILTLEEFKRSRFRDIERRTTEVLARGFEYNGVRVSLSTDALVKYQGLAGLSSLLTAVTVEAADPMDQPLVLAALLSPAAFVASVNAYVRDVYEAESALKAPIRNALTQAGVEAVVDAR